MSFISYAQNYEDVMLARALHDVGKGFYIDVGAQDPTEFSVTKAFYDLGWRGINIEPVSHWFERLCGARQHDINLQLAASEKPGELRLFEVMDSGLSTVNPEFAERHAQAGFCVQESSVECKTLDEICEDYVVSDVHFLKIDCEGAETFVLSGFSLKRVRPWIILVEATEPLSQEPTYVEWEPLLTERGYHFVYEDGLNRFYVADEHKELDQGFSHPPNIFDDFVRVSELSARNELQVARADLSLLHEAQHLARAESECELLRANVKFLQSENERREAALIEHRRLLEEAAERETQNLVRVQAESEQQRVSVEFLNSENERREAALVEHRRLLEGATERETQNVARVRAESEQWRASAEYQRSENERREAALVEHRRLLEGAMERETQNVARVRAESEQWRASAEYLRSENQRREAALIEHLRLLQEAAEREIQSVALAQAESEHWRADAERLGARNVHKTQVLNERQQAIDALAETLAESHIELAAALGRATLLSGELTNHQRDRARLHTKLAEHIAEIPELQSEIGRLHHEVVSRDQEVSHLHGLIQTIQHSMSWRITYPLRLAKRGVYAVIGMVCRIAYHVLRWPAHLCRPLLCQMARWSWLRTLAVRIAGPDSRLTAYTRLFLFGASPVDQSGESPESQQSDMPITRHAAQVLEEIQDARRKRLQGHSTLQPRRK